RATSNEQRATHDITFWEGKFNNFTPYTVDVNINRYEFLAPIINDIHDKNILEIGCGNGDMSIFLAKHGAKVFSIDNTNNGINNALALADFNGVKIQAQVMDALDVDKLPGKFDFVVGKFILHHIEPFDKFAEKIKLCMNESDYSTKIHRAIKF
ncbi:MAG: class I SAM-dependent methyltransferase, partial [Synergistaceae bacterium]|nr:class I SAM-dependent methyltransferase [Synergistaceae bacterium]